MKATKVWSPGGYMPGPVNSLVGKDETLYSPTNGRAQLVEKGKVGVDNQPSSIREDDDNIILGNDRNWNTGNKISQEAKPITLQLMRYNKIEDKISNLQKKSNLDSLSKQTQKLNTDMLSRAKQPLLDGLDRLSQIQKTQHDIEDYTHTMNKFAKGKEYAPGHIPQWWPLAGNMIGAGASALKLSHWLANRPETTDIYAANRYAPQALRTLNSARINPYSIMQRLQLADRNAAYELANNGGYSGGQRQANRTALALGNQRNIANALESAQEKNIGFRNTAAQAMLQAGESDAARRQAANQYRFDQYVRSHGARVKGIESSLADLAKFGQQYWADKIKYKQYADTLGLYQQDVNNRKEALNAMLGGSKTTTTPTANSTITSNTNSQQIKPQNYLYDMNLSQRQRLPSNWQDKAIENIGKLPLPDLPYKYTNFIDTLDWLGYFNALKKENDIIIGNNKIPRSKNYTYYDDENFDNAHKQLANLIPYMFNQLPDSSKYFEAYQKVMGKPAKWLRENNQKLIGGDLFKDTGEYNGFTRALPPSVENGSPATPKQIARGLILYNPNFKIPSLNKNTIQNQQQYNFPGFYMNTPIYNYRY